MSIIRFLASASLAALVIGAPSLASAQVTKQGAGYLFRIKYTPKQKSSFKVSVQSPMGGTQKPMTLTMITKSVTGTQAVVDNTMDTGMANQKPQTYTVTVDNRGRIIKSSQPGAEGLSSLQFPEKAISVGGTWTGTVKMSGVDAKSTYKLIGVKAMGGVPCAQIGVTLSGEMAQMKMKMTGTGTMYVRLADGTMQNSTMAMNMTIQMPNQQAGSKPTNMKINMTMSRV